MDQFRQVQLDTIEAMMIEEGILKAGVKARLLLEALEELEMTELIEYAQRERDMEYAC